MMNVSQEIQDLSIKSLESTYNKLSNAYSSMTEKGSNTTTLVQKRRDAVKIGLESIKHTWYGVDFSYDKETILTAKDILQGTLPSIEKQIEKAKEGSSQKTLNERRLNALKLAIESLERELEQQANVYFRDIDNTNEMKVRNLKLKPEQEKFIESVDDCLKEAKVYPEWHPVAIYSDDEVIGFAMYGSFGPNKDTWIDRIMIDEKYQGRGLGRMAMRKLIDIVSKKYGVNVIYLSIVEENTAAYRLYKSMGFEYMNERDPNGELLFKYTIY